MKPASNHNTLRGGVTAWQWRYMERKVGVYLTLRTPLTANPEGTLGWQTWFHCTPRGSCQIERKVWKLRSGLRRKLQGLPARHDYVFLNLQPIYGAVRWKVVTEYPDGSRGESPAPPIRYGWAPPERFGWTGGLWSDPIDFDLGVDIERFHESCKVMIANCAKQGEFRVLVDWLCETYPALAPYFQTCGDVP